MNKRLIINKIKFICFNKTETPSSSGKEPRFSRLWTREGSTVTLNRDEAKAFSEIVNELFSDPTIYQNFSIVDINKALEEIISKVLQEPRNKREEKIKEEIDVFLQDLNSKISEWIFIFPVENLKLSVKQLKLNDVKIFNFTKYHANKYLKSLQANLDQNPHYRNNEEFIKSYLNQIKERFIKPLTNIKICAEIKVHGTLKGAEQKALRKLDLTLGIIKLFTPINSYSLKNYFGLYGELIRHSKRESLNYKSDKTEFNAKLEKTGYLYPFDLNREDINSMKKYGLNKILEIERKNNKTDLEKRILNSLIWFSKAYDIPICRKPDSPQSQNSTDTEYYNLGDKYLKLMIALECLLIFGMENKKENLSKRCSYVITDSFEERQRIQNYIKNAYNIRSKIVHEGEYSVTQDEASELMKFVQHSILTLIKFIGRWKIKTNEDLYQWLEKNRLRDRKINN